MGVQEICYLVLDLAMNRRSIDSRCIFADERRIGCDLRWARIDEDKVATWHDLLLRRHRQTRGNGERIAWGAE